MKVQQRIRDGLESIRRQLAARGRRRAAAEVRDDLDVGAVGDDFDPAGDGPPRAGRRTAFDLRRAAVPLVVAGIAVASAALVIRHPPLQAVGRDEVGVRVNGYTGTTSQWGEGSVFVFPGVHELRLLTLRDQSFKPTQMSRADGPAPLQSVEGLSLGADVTVRYALDRALVGSVGRNLPINIGADIVDPAVQGVIYKTFARYTVREIFSTKRVEIAQALEAELKPRLALDGLVLRGVQIGKIDLPADYKRGMDTLLAEELASEKMRYTLELKDKRVKETELDAQAEKVRREVTAEAAARETVIAAKAQEEAMKHVLPFKQRQIEQRQLEAEADKVSRIRTAEGSAQARRIEADGEADARQKLADAEVYRLDRVGKTNAEQMAREGALVTRHPLLIQKTLADKLADKIQVIIAPPSADGGFLGAALLGGHRRETQLAADAAAGEQHAAAGDGSAKGEP